MDVYFSCGINGYNYQFVLGNSFPYLRYSQGKTARLYCFRQAILNYLNLIEKINRAYCSYVNGLFGYLQEIAERTEQFLVSY